MPLPTLLGKGAIVPQKWMNQIEKRKAANQISLDFILDFIAERTPARRHQKPKIMSKSIGDKVILLKSGTGSGKSTTLPPGLFRRFHDFLHKTIGVTEPRRLTAETIPYDILRYNSDFQMEKNIGFRTSLVSKRPASGILFMTEGILLQHFKTLTDEEFIRKYMFIIIDEFHTRSMEIDSLLFYAKRFFERNYDNPDCPILILMSATFEKETYVKYYGVPTKNYIEVQGRAYKREFNFEIHPVNNWLERVTELVKQIHTSDEGLTDVGIIKRNIDDKKEDEYIPADVVAIDIDIGNIDVSRDILIFVQGQAQIDAVLYNLHLLNLDKDFIKGGYIRPIGLTSAVYHEGGEAYQSLLNPIENVTVQLLDMKNDRRGGYSSFINEHDDEYIGGAGLKTAVWQSQRHNVTRRVTAATNVAETGITIDTLKYCIDTGFVFDVEFNSTFGSKMIMTKNVTKGSAEQRAGRVGRKAPGVVFPLYTKDLHDMFLKDQHPQIIIKEFTPNILSSIINETESELEEVPINIAENTPNDESIYMHSNNIKYKLVYAKSFNALSLDYLSYPAADAIQYALEKLYMLGFITQKGSTLAPSKNRCNGEIVPTIMGYFADKLRHMSIENKRMVLAGYRYGCNVLDLITIASFLEIGWRNIAQKIDRRKFTPMNPLNLKTKEEIILTSKLFFADEFIEYLWIWLLFMEQLDKLGASNLKKKTNNSFISSITKWAEDNGLVYNSLVHVIRKRDENMESFLFNGLNIFYNGLDLARGTYNLLDIIRNNRAAGMEEIKKIKHCIYEGYRLNVATYDRNLRSYVLDYKKTPLAMVGSPLITPLPFEDGIEQTRPKKIIVSDIMVRANFLTPGLYSFMSGDCIAVLDGFIVIDDNFIDNYP